MKNKSIVMPSCMERIAQRGVKMGYKQFAFNDSATRWMSSPISVGTADFSIEYYGNMFGADVYSSSTIFNVDTTFFGANCLMIYGVDTPENRLACVAFEGPSATETLFVPYVHPELEGKFHLVVTRSGRTIKAYVNGEMKGSLEQTSVKNFTAFRLGLANSSDIALCRMYDYALSAEQVVRLNNDGDPAGYLLPAVLRCTTPKLTYAERSAEFGLKDAYCKPFMAPGILERETLYEVTYTVDAWDFQPATCGLVGIFASGSVHEGACAWLTADAAKVGVQQKCLVATGSDPWIALYGGLSAGATARNLRVTVHNVQPVGCVAEYLPQNIVPVPCDPCSVELTGITSYTWSGSDDTNYAVKVPLSRELTVGCVYKITLTVSGYEAGSPMFALSGSTVVPLPAAAGTYTLYVEKMSEYPAYLYIYGGEDGADRRLTVSVDSIESADNIGLRWYDSARREQSDACQMPLAKSLGGYDLVGEECPKILSNR